VAVVNDDATIHVLYEGRPLCGYRLDVCPGDWPDGHMWVAIEFLEDSNCDLCIAAAPMFLPGARVVDSEPMTGKLAQARHQAVVAAMRQAVAERDDLEHWNHELKVERAELKERVASLYQALAMYGQHLPECLLMADDEEALPSAACTCGYLNAMMLGGR
jgi:ferredoxin-thioredoxin reductase catalytic subunit